jgi:hypothetical protein
MKTRSFLRRYLTAFLLLFFFVQSAIAQTVLTGDKVSRVMASRNYVINPNAQTNLAGVASGGFTVTRSLTTPISDLSTEFNISGTGLTINAALWTVSPLSAGLKGAQCEARFRYRNANSSTVFQVRQGATGSTANVIALLTATVDANNTTQGSIPFPCGDLSVATWLAVTGTSLSTMELAEVSIGQVQAFGDYTNITSWQSYAPTFTGFGSPITGVGCFYRRVLDTLEAQCRYSTAAHTAVEARVSLPPGLTVGSSGIGLASQVGTYVVNTTADNNVKFGPLVTASGVNYFVFGVGEYTETLAPLTGVNATTFPSTNTFSFSARVPIAEWAITNTAVTPGSQNVFGGTKFTGSGVQSYGATSWTTFNSGNYSSQTRTGGALVASSTCGLATNDLGACYQNIPAGIYRLTFNGALRTTFLTALTQCNFSILDTLGNRVSGAIGTAGISGSFDNTTSLDGLVTITSFQTNYGFAVQAAREAGGGGDCQHIISATANAERQSELKLERVDSQNTQPVFIQSPVRAAGTGVAPIAGEVGERLSQSNTTASNAVNNTPFSTPAVPLTPGCWDFSVTSTLNSTGTLSGTGSTDIAITTASGAFTGSTLGDTRLAFFANSSVAAGSIPPKRICVTSTTNYFGTSQVSLTSGTGTQFLHAQAVRANDR